MARYSVHCQRERLCQPDQATAYDDYILLFHVVAMHPDRDEFYAIFTLNQV